MSGRERSVLVLAEVGVRDFVLVASYGRGRRRGSDDGVLDVLDVSVLAAVDLQELTLQRMDLRSVVTTSGGP